MCETELLTIFLLHSCRYDHKLNNLLLLSIGRGAFGQVALVKVMISDLS